MQHVYAGKPKTESKSRHQNHLRMKALFTIAIFAVACTSGGDVGAKGAGKMDKEIVRKTTEDRVMFLNGANFDFSGKLAANYVGHFNILAPDIDKSERWGFNTGIMRLNYFNVDTLRERTTIENVLLDPLYPELKTGDRYLRQLSKYSTVVKNSVWCFYVQPMYRLTEKSGRSAIYAHAHAELLAKKFSAVTKIKMMKQDTLTVGTDENLVARADVGEEYTYSSTSLDGYFGLGLTFDLVSGEKSSFFFQPTFGVTTDNPIEVNGAVLATRSYSRADDPMRGFYLVRAYYTHVVSDNATLNIGTDIRGILPKFDPLYAAYIGVNVNMEGVLNLFGLGKTTATGGAAAPKAPDNVSATDPGEPEANYDR